VEVLKEKIATYSRMDDLKGEGFQEDSGAARES
jgi:hypothetical protein